jgi:putative DNA methylase
VSDALKYPKRLIEVDLPIKRVSAHARREKSIRHGHISTLHIWWARRPLGACRAVICSALWPDPADPLCPVSFRNKARSEMLAWTSLERQKLCSEEGRRRFELARKKPTLFDDPKQVRAALFDFIADFANWDNSAVPEFLDTSSVLTRAAHESLGGAAGTRPLVVDPFAGGGSIPLEALRVGADAFASDLNPIPVLLNKVILEYVPKYGKRLADEVRKWGGWLTNQAEQALVELYPKDPNGAIPVAYLWARTIKCEGPGCGVDIPLFRSALLANKGKNSVYLKMKVDRESKSIDFDILKGPPQPGSSAGVMRRSSATCPVCGYSTPAANVRAQFTGRQGGAADARLLAVVTNTAGESGRLYRACQPYDQAAVTRAVSELKEIANTAPNDIPDEPLPYLRSIFNIHLLDVTKWSQLYTPRQLVSLIRLMRLVREAGEKIQGEISDPNLQAAVMTCLALAVDRVAAQFTSLSWWQPKGEFVAGTFGRQALGIVWDFAEIRPVKGASGDLDGALDWVTRVVESGVNSRGSQATVVMASATKEPLPDDFAAAVVTDPPYYDAVPYADLSDFFYVLLKRMLKGIHGNLFDEILTPKNGEIVQLAERNPIYAFKTKEYFEKGMQDALRDARRVTVPNGIAVVVFAHKTTEGWEVMLSSVISAGWVVTASWPIDTERAVRMRATDSAALASSVHLVCRPRESRDGELRSEIGDWREVLQELPIRIHAWMPRLVDEGVVGADAIFACLGPALEIFSRYSRVEKANGEAVTLREYLEQVWAAVAREALATVLHDSDSGSLEPDARLTVIWLWTLGGGSTNGDDDSDTDSDDADEDDEATTKTPAGYVLEFDAARKIAQGLGANLEALGHVVAVKGDKARLLAVADRTQYLFGKMEGPPTAKRAAKKKQIPLFAEIEEVAAEQGWGEVGAPKAGTTTLDRVHQAMLLFASARSEALKRFLVEEGIGRQAPFWKLAQALAALYPSGSDERRWVEGVLARKKGLGFG